MGRFALKEILGAGSLVAGVVILFFAMDFFADHDPLAAVVSAVSGLSLVFAGVELLRPSLGE